MEKAKMDRADIFELDQTVKVFHGMYPRRDFKCLAVINHIGPMHSSKEKMLWMTSLYDDSTLGAWHPDAVEHITAEELQCWRVYLRRQEKL